MALTFTGGGLAGNAPNYVEPGNNPDQSSPWLTDYSAPPAAPTGTITFGPLTIKKAAAKPKASSGSTTARPKAALVRTGAAGSILDKILPLSIDASGVKTIFGLPPAIVYVAGGILSATLIALLIRMLRGGGGRRSASNPKRARAARRAQR